MRTTSKRYRGTASGRLPLWMRRVDPSLFFVTLGLCLFSIVTVFAARHNFGNSKFVMQTAMAAAGLIVCVILSNIKLKFFIERFSWIFLALSAVLLIVTLLFGTTGASRDTANRSWLTIWPFGIAVQPSEFVKVTFICTFAYHLSLVRTRINKPLVLLGLLAHAGLIVGLILLSGDLGVALVYCGIVAVMLYAAGLSGWYFVGVATVIAGAFPFLWQLLAPYQKERIIYGFKPELDPLGKGMQPLMSRSAIAAGGFLGQGLHGGSIYEDLPASHTDFIFATVCEKFGFVGGFLCLAGLGFLIYRIFRIALATHDPTGKFICCGVGAVLLLQTLENIAMSLALVPVIGITLPLMSCGGSSMLATFLLIGLVCSVRTEDKESHSFGGYL